MEPTPRWYPDIGDSGMAAVRAAEGPPALPQETGHPPMSFVEKALLGLIIVTLPLESHITIIPGYSIQFIMFGAIACYVAVRDYGILLRVMGHPVFLSAYLFFLYAIAMEVTAPHASFEVLTRTGQMIVGAILVASICRDRQSLNIALLGYIVAGLWLSVMLFLTSYGAIQRAAASDFEEASKLRAEVFAETAIEADLNSMAFSAGLGAVVSIALALKAPTALSRNIFLGGGVFCLVATFLPLSRGGAAIAVLACASVMYAFGLRGAKALLIIAVLATIVWIVVPQAVWSRMAFSFEERDGKRDGRASVYQAAIDHLPEYILTGVGAGNFWSNWGLTSDFKGSGRRVGGAHNSLIQVALYWGIGGLLTFLMICWQAYRCLPRHNQWQAAPLCLLGISVSLLLYAQVVHTIYAKEFALGLGLLAGSHCWIWPNGIVPKDS
jgi:hypothetical protein